MIGVLTETMLIHDIVGNAIIQGSVIFGDIVTSSREVIDKAAVRFHRVILRFPVRVQATVR